MGTSSIKSPEAKVSNVEGWIRFDSVHPTVKLVNGTVQNHPKPSDRPSEPNLSKLIAVTDPAALAIKRFGRATCCRDVARDGKR